MIWDQETWVWVPDTDYKLQASTWGRVRIRNGEGFDLVCSYWGDNGYRMLNKIGYLVTCRPSVHQVIAFAFHGVCKKRYHTHHKDGSKTNNRPENLEYLSPGDHRRKELRRLDRTAKRYCLREISSGIYQEISL